MKLQKEEMQGLSNHSGRSRIAVYQLDDSTYHHHRNKKWTIHRCMALFVPLVVILAAVVGLAFAFSGSDSLPSIPTPPIFDDEGDPFKGSDDANRWNNRNSGLVLEVLNALEDEWEILFELAINDWDGGQPDALTLITSKVAIDNVCDPVEGKLKVCNGDYGETKWRGINQVLLSNGFIISSVAKLNEFYLADADQSQRRYTMCHEIGHGFGLPHTDENFFNADLGNCMDYTSNPETNKSPDETNFMFLRELYGPVVRQNRVRTRRKRQRKLRGNNDNDNEEEEEEDALTSELKDLPDFTEKLLFRYGEAILQHDGLNSFPDTTTTTKKKNNQQDENKDEDQMEYKMMIIHKSDHFEAQSIDLGDGFELRLHMFLAEPNKT